MAERETINLAVVGAGRVGGTLGRRWSQAGHSITYGLRRPADPKYQELGGHGRLTDVAEAVSTADVVLLAVPWAGAEDAAKSLGSVGSRVVIDATNPLTGDMRGHERESLSGAEQIRDWLDGGRVIKAFNTTGAGNMAHPEYPSAMPMMPLAGDDHDAKAIVAGLAEDIGFDAVDAGPLSAAADLEYLAVLWIRLAYTLGNGPDIAFALLRR